MSYMEQKMQEQIEAGIGMKEQQDQDRIKLAEAIGWTRVKPYRGRVYGLPPGALAATDALWLEFCLQVPDPLKDANDCEALIKCLNERDMAVEIEIFGQIKDSEQEDMDDEVVFRNGSAQIVQQGYFDDWKQGVCDLALRVFVPVQGKDDG